MQILVFPFAGLLLFALWCLSLRLTVFVLFSFSFPLHLIIPLLELLVHIKRGLILRTGKNWMLNRKHCMENGRKIWMLEFMELTSLMQRIPKREKINCGIEMYSWFMLKIKNKMKRERERIPSQKTHMPTAHIFLYSTHSVTDLEWRPHWAWQPASC